MTRQPPAEMAREAACLVERFGFRALNVKGGQGIETDLAASREIAKAVDTEIAFYVGANAAYPWDCAADYVRAIADAGALIAEDPCPLQPDAEFAALQSASPIPILVDMPCISVADAKRFLTQDARSLSVNPGRVGMTEAGRIVALAEAAGASVCSGMYAESGLGTLISLQFAAGLRQPLMPAEQSFFLLMNEQILHETLHVRDGRIELPESADCDVLVDWERVLRLGTSV